MAPPRTVVTTPSCNLLLIYRPRKDERLSCPSWHTYSGRFTHTSGHPSAVGRAQDSESSPVKDQRSTIVPRKDDLERQQTLPRSPNGGRATPLLLLLLHNVKCILIRVTLSHKYVTGTIEESQCKDCCLQLSSDSDERWRSYS